MNDFGSSQDGQLLDAAELIKAGRKKDARRVLREVLSADRNNLVGWELLWSAAYNIKEELFCLNRILAIDPNHAAAKKRFEKIKSTDAGLQKSKIQPPSSGGIRPMSRSSPRRSPSRRKRQQSTLLFLLFGALISLVCVTITGFAMYRGGYIPFGAPSSLTATAIAQKNASCQALIEKAIQASGSYCDHTSSNQVCYGNTSIMAELVPDASQRFSERGDIVPVHELQRLSASPLNLANSEWGIAVFKIIANLPRSLPGETVTMVVFGNTTLDNDSRNSQNLESFYFSSELGQISCEKVPFDGLMVTSPSGSGVHFMVNGAELTLMGSATIKALKNEKMEVSMFKGSGKIVSDGQQQYFGAGQKVSVQLGGENGNQSISAPSAPEPLTQAELDMACSMTGQYCSQSAITPVSEDQAQVEIQNEITSTPTIVPTRTLTLIPSSTIPVTNTLLVLPSSTGSPGPTRTPTRTKTPGPTKTAGPTRTTAPTLTFTITNTPSQTNTPTQTNTFTPTFTLTPSLTPSNTPIPTLTPVGPPEPLCGASVSLGPLTNPNPNNIAMDITNNSGGPITVNRFFAYWVKTPSSQKLDRLLLDTDLLWNTSDPTPPSDIPAEGSWRAGVNFIINNTATRTLLVQFQDALQSTGYEIHVVFDSGCQVVGKQ